jgi:L-aspartate oxidase
MQHPDLAANWDVVVVGSGAAGLMTCLELPAGLRVLLLSKQDGPPSASRWAQGGIAAVTRPEDSFESHIQDTLRAGADLCDRRAVDLLVRDAPGCVARLLELGMGFDREEADQLSTTLEAAHSHRRVLHAQDRTGGALVDALEREVLRREGLEQHKGVPALQLWVEAGRCVGLQVLDGHRLRWLRARAVVLACGGGGHLFAHTTNPAQASGDGVAMAWSAGAAVRDLEFVQFHPTALMLAGAPHFLISEAVRGEGARLCDAAGNSPVAQLAGGDLAPRDQVSRALARRMQELGVDNLWLDLRPVGQARLDSQFPTILGRCRALGLDPIGAAEFDELIATLQKTLGLTVFMVTHDLDSLYSICDRIAALADGKVVAVAPLQEMLACAHPWVRSYFHGKRALRFAAPPASDKPAP